MYRWVEHTGELELEIEAAREAGVFEEAFAAIREVLAAEPHEEAEHGDQASRAVEVSAADRATLLAEWISELAFLAETEGLVPVRLARLELADRRLWATVEGYVGSPPHLVKAVTYHRLEFERAGDGWRATVVLDV